ncbi:unnamed protein product [Macrosiphum euphorbiae]|uniref:Mutator-like transposase domain-containing protein n=1 Tax=Macrosiphum euphorbiae TaxID=13131 RepID=A0AAV0WAH7_9HEMI|nr:unnamed protein product [Macrosiphum euphorbiae]
MIFKEEEKQGYFSIFHFKCKMCGIEKKISCENTKNVECIPINKAVVNATIAIGIGYAQLSELSASIDIPPMSSNTYQSMLSSVGDVVHASAWDEMKNAGDEEREIALKNGILDEDGTPMCTVIADGQWSKRSYKTKYDAFSGAATIIGYNTRKVLFVGIRNRYCSICQKALNRDENKPAHNCFFKLDK